MLAIDVGMKNLSCCMGNLETKKIIKIDLLNLVNDVEENTVENTVEIKKKCNNCKRNSNYFFNDLYYCKTHIPTPLLPENLELYEKNSISKLKELFEIYKIEIPKKIKKENFVSILKTYILNNYTVSLSFFQKKVKIEKCKDLTIIDLGKKLKIKLDYFLSDVLHLLNTVVIEQQLNTNAIRMTILQGMIIQYFVMKKPELNIKTISPHLKLSPIVCGDYKIENNTYTNRKKASVEIAKKYLEKYEGQNSQYLNIINNSKKKDDYCDSYLFFCYEILIQK